MGSSETFFHPTNGVKPSLEDWRSHSNGTINRKWWTLGNRRHVSVMALIYTPTKNITFGWICLQRFIKSGLHEPDNYSPQLCVTVLQFHCMIITPLVTYREYINWVNLNRNHVSAIEILLQRPRFSRSTSYRKSLASISSSKSQKSHLRFWSNSDLGYIDLRSYYVR